MAETFRGEFYQKVDGKARVSIPAPFRRVLESGDPAKGANPRVVIVYGGDRAFVECYTIEEMAKVERRIARMPMGSPQRRYLERNLITLSQTVEIDGDGRIVLSPKARARMGMTVGDGTEAVFAGTLDKFQIWRSDAYEAEINSAFPADILPDGMDMLSLLPPDPEE